MPKENGLDYDPVAQGMEVSKYGTNKILDCLKECGVKGTFFCTTNFASNAPEVIKRIMEEGHEIAAHGCDHFNPVSEDTDRCKKHLEKVTGRSVRGWRQPRMFPVNNKALHSEGYTYNASLNPAFIPGRYMHLRTPRTWFMQDGVMQIPASVSPWLRIPMFWLSLHNFPLWLYKALCRRIVKHDGYFNTYFHPWEFYPLGEHPELKIMYIVKRHAGKDMYNRLKEVILDLKSRGYEFGTYSEFAASKVKSIN